MNFRTLYIYVIIIFPFQNVFSQPEQLTDAYFQNIFSGNYPQAKQIILELNKNYPESLKTKLIIANYYAVMYETSNSDEKYFIVCKKYADEAIHKLEKKKALNNEEVYRIISAKSILLKIDVKKKNYLNVAKNMKSVIPHFEYAIKHEKEDFKMKFISGMYNYYVETAKEDYPVIYPILLFYPSGNKEKGLKLMKECTQSKDKNTRARSLLQLAEIYYRDEKNIKTAEIYFEKLLKLYPDNLVWQTEYFKALKKYNLTDKFTYRQQIINQLIKKSTILTEEQKNYFTKQAEL